MLKLTLTFFVACFLFAWVNGQNCDPNNLCTLDVAFGLDKSGSMTVDLNFFCQVIQNLQAALLTQCIDANLYLYIYKTTFDVNTEPFCFNLPPEFGKIDLSTIVPLPGHGPCYDAADPNYPTVIGDLESWAAGSSLICQLHSWRPNTDRVVVFVSDEAPCRGDDDVSGGAPACGQLDYDSITDETAFIQSLTPSCTVFGMVPIRAVPPPYACTLALANQFATDLGGQVVRYLAGNAANGTAELRNVLDLIVDQSRCTATVAPTDAPTLAPTGSCSDPGTFHAAEDDNACDMCTCFSGYGGEFCEDHLVNGENCDYYPLDNLAINKNHVSHIDQAGTGFNGGIFTIRVVGGAVEKTQVQYPNARVSIISVGQDSLDDFLPNSLSINPTPGTGISGPPDWDESVCRCFDQTVTSVGGVCTDVFTLARPWDFIRDNCCDRNDDDPLWLVYNCTLDVYHYDWLVFEGDWDMVPTRNRIARNPLPLFVKFQRQINLTSIINVFADLDIKAYIHLQTFSLTTNQGAVQIDVVTLWPYQLRLDGWEVTSNNGNNYQFVNLALDTIYPGFDEDSTKTCNNVAGSKCWQTIHFEVVPGVDVCNMDFDMHFVFFPSCRTAECPQYLANITQEALFIDAEIRSEDWCPIVEFEFQLNGTLTTWAEDFAYAEHNFIVYEYINDALLDQASALCIKATVNVDNAASGQGYTNQDITETYFRGIWLYRNGVFSTVYDDTQSPSLCPGLTAECLSGPIDAQIDTEGTNVWDALLLDNEAGACFYLTVQHAAGHPHPWGLMDVFNLPVHIEDGPYEFEIRATVAVVFEDQKREVHSQVANVGAKGLFQVVDYGTYGTATSIVANLMVVLLAIALALCF